MYYRITQISKCGVLGARFLTMEHTHTHASYTTKICIYTHTHAYIDMHINIIYLFFKSWKKERSTSIKYLDSKKVITEI